MNPDDYRKETEKKILEIIEDKLKSGQMNAARAREIARYILQILHPPLTLDDIYIKVQDFDKHFPELLPAMLPVVTDYEEKIKAIVTEHAQKLIKENKIEEADTLLKQALSKQVKLGK